MVLSHTLGWPPWDSTHHRGCRGPEASLSRVGRAFGCSQRHLSRAIRVGLEGALRESSGIIPVLGSVVCSGVC
jgi:hypothetical protein